VENGSAIFIPRAYFPFPFDYHKAVGDLLAIELAIPYSRVRKLLAKISDENDFHFRGFRDMSAAEVAEITGLNLESAKLAKQREYDEPVVIEVSRSPEHSEGEAKQSRIIPKDISEFLAKLGEAGLNWAYGGRLYHVMGGGDKGKAVEILSGLYRKLWGKIKTVGLGNGLNDLPMLSHVDIPILVQKRDYSWEDINLPHLRRVQGVGPEGWSRAIVEIFGD
jgi:mannosyl-3-phosphoglycerate phosphatase